MRRRTFMKNAVLSAAGLSLGVTGCENVINRGPGLLEGLYTDRFTYRYGENIRLYSSLQSGLPVDIDLVRTDRIPVIRYKRITTVPTQTQQLTEPGRHGAHFDLVAEFPASDLPKGLYKGTMPASALQPQNRSNTWNGFPTVNWEISFLVTDAVPGSRSRLLLLHDTFTGTCYGGFGDRSIYANGAPINTVHLMRPGNARSTTAPNFPLRHLHDLGYEFEYLDLYALNQAPLGFLDAYDLIVMVSTHEYQTHGTMSHLKHFLDGGGNLFMASNEFGTFRLRVTNDRLVSYKWRAEAEDDWSLAASSQGDPVRAAALRAHVAGVGMSDAVGSPSETEISGQTVWLAHRVAPGTPVALNTSSHPETDWIFANSGITPGDDIPAAVREFNTGNVIEFDNQGNAFIPEPELTGTPPQTLVWGSTPSTDGRDWTQMNGQSATYWPRLDCHALASYQQRASGGQVVTLPGNSFLTDNMHRPEFQKILENVIGQMSQRA